ncbi:MAG: phage antirepressor KilAC domain-containing protein [Clostridia bacterium]|jgi:anti-repressor protein|nr:phage antirepressor KilAC domain-containing protein [Clostridia bacterium]
MNEIIPINYDSDRPTVSAIELHKFLGIGTKFQDWFPRMIGYGFKQGTDFNPLKIENVLSQKRERTYSATDYQLTIDMAKELCMIQRTEKGKEARQYFLSVEKAWNSPEQIMARALKMADTQIATLKGENKQLSSQIEKDRPKIVFADAVAVSESPMLIGELAKVLKQNGFNTGGTRLFEWLRNNGYLVKRKGTDYNAPTQKAMDMGLFRVKETAITHSDGHVTTNRTTKVTGKGQQYFINKFLSKEV